MAQDLTQHFVNLRRVRLAANPFTELGLDLREDRLDVAALVVVRFALRLVGLIEVIHALPQFGLLCNLIVKLAVRDVRDSALDQRQAGVVKAVIAVAAGLLKLFEYGGTRSVSRKKRAPESSGALRSSSVS
jgi:hypothetical protein